MFVPTIAIGPLSACAPEFGDTVTDALEDKTTVKALAAANSFPVVTVTSLKPTAAAASMAPVDSMKDARDSRGGGP